MIVVYNNYIPFGSFYAINLFGVVFCKRGKGVMGMIDKNHEYIHTLQQRELLFVGFYLLYILEWVYRFAKTGNSRKAYNCISFEKEAYSHQMDLNYKRKRRFFAWLKHI